MAMRDEKAENVGLVSQHLDREVNTASRVEGLAKNYPCKIILTQSLYDILGEDCRSTCVYLDRVKVKGKEEELEIYGVPD